MAKYKKTCECGNTIIYSDQQEYVTCSECGKKFKNSHYVDDFEFEEDEPQEKTVVVVQNNIDPGSSLAGFLLVFFLGFIGWIIALAAGKPKTRKAANITVLIQVILIVIAVIIAVAAVGLGSDVDTSAINGIIQFI